MVPFVAAPIVRAASIVPYNPSQGVVVAGGHSSWTFIEKFEGTGYDSGLTWVESGTVDEDYTTTVLHGSQSCLLDGSSATASTRTPSQSAVSEWWAYGRVRFISIPASSLRVMFRFNTTSTTRYECLVNSTGTIRVSHGSATANTVATVSTGTLYHFWFYYLAGSGADGTGWVAFSTDGTKPTSGDNFAQTIVGTSTTTVNRVMIIADNTGGVGYQSIWDTVGASTVVIGDNPVP